MSVSPLIWQTATPCTMDTTQHQLVVIKPSNWDVKVQPEPVTSHTSVKQHNSNWADLVSDTRAITRQRFVLDFIQCPCNNNTVRAHWQPILQSTLSTSHLMPHSHYALAPTWPSANGQQQTTTCICTAIEPVDLYDCNYHMAAVSWSTDVLTQGFVHLSSFAPLQRGATWFLLRLYAEPSALSTHVH